jgi:HAD superfamily hydrolase (TIGR01549 family)
MSNVKHIWFDLAGTLYKETAKFNEVHDHFRYTTYAKVAGVKDPVKAKEEFLEMYKKQGSNSAVFTALGKPSGFWMKSLESMDFTAVLDPDPEVTETLKKLKEVVPLSLFTNFHKDRIVELLEYLNIPAEWFVNILTGDDIAARKPALDGFHEMVKRSEAPAESLLYVGDRVDVDIKPAKLVGMKTCLVYGNSEEADYCVGTFPEILKIAQENEAFS